MNYSISDVKAVVREIIKHPQMTDIFVDAHVAVDCEFDFSTDHAEAILHDFANSPDSIQAL